MAIQPMTPRGAQILRSAAQLFAKRGFHGVSISELGAAVGISGPALYRHFASKEALLSRMLVEVSERLLAGGTSLAAHGPLRRDLQRWLARARHAGLYDESIEALFLNTFRSAAEEDIA